jgi:CHAT domain-containing protein/tetratricopeptide (TPR) repeat protein
MGLALCLACGPERPLREARAPAAPAPPPRPVSVQPLRLAPGTVASAAGPAAGETHAYSFSLASGQYADLSVEQLGVDVAVRLLDPAGRELARVDGTGGDRGPEPVPVIGEPPGIYRLEVTGSSPGGRYEIRVAALRPATARDREQAEAERLLARGEELRQRDDPGSIAASGDLERRALAAFRALGRDGRDDRAAETLFCLGWGASSAGRYDDALASLNEALALYRRVGPERKVGSTLNFLGQIRLQLGQPDAALAADREALALHRRLGERRAEALSLTNLGRAWSSLGESQKALESYEAALGVWRRLGARREEAATLKNLGDLYQVLGEPARAFDALEQALAFYRGAGATRDEARTLASIGSAYGRAGDGRRALALLRQALVLERKTGDRRQEGLTLNDLGWTAIELGDWRAARNGFAAALAVFREIGDRTDEGAALAHLGWAEDELGDPRAAVEHLESALPLLAASRSRNLEATALLGLARARRHTGDPEGALRAVRAGIETIESLRGGAASLDLRSSFLASKQAFYGFEIDLLMERHRSDLALGTSEEARARSLLDLLAGARRAASTAPAPLDAAGVRALLDPGTVLLEYSLGDERGFVWLVEPGGVSGFELPPRAAIEKQARLTASLLARGQSTLARGPATVAMAELSRMLLAPLRPVADRLAGKRLVVVPDGALHYIPFAALPEPGGAAPLVDGHEIVTLPSASALAALRRETAGRRSPDGTLAVVADPVFGAEDPRVGGGGAPRLASLRGGANSLGRLPFSREEADALLALVPPSRRLAALGFQASRDTVLSGRLAGYRLVHFATHGVLDTAHPELSGIALSRIDPQGRPVDGFLRARDLDRLRLPADLVVLSACRTALGREVRGEGLVGLTRGFLSAGARGVLVSLWEVEDRATAELMERLYREMLERGRTPAAALRAAQAALRREPGREAPYYWAGFVLEGDWHTPDPPPPGSTPRNRRHSQGGMR